MIKILDCTTRDGGHNTNWNFTTEFVMDRISMLNKFKAGYYEIGYRNHIDNEDKGQFYNCTPEFLKQFYKEKGNLLLGVMTDIKRFSIDDFQGYEKDSIDFIRIACHPDRIEETLNNSKKLHDRGYKIFVQLMDISNVDETGYFELYKWEHKNILESLYFADSYGTLYPEDVEKYYNKLKMLGYKKISFHGHNNIKMALKNSLKAIELGAYSIDTTFDGMGRCGGNLNESEFYQAYNI